MKRDNFPVVLLMSMMVVLLFSLVVFLNKEHHKTEEVQLIEESTSKYLKVHPSKKRIICLDGYEYWYMVNEGFFPRIVDSNSPTGFTVATCKGDAHE